MLLKILQPNMFCLNNLVIYFMVLVLVERDLQETFYHVRLGLK